ncbi:MAG: YceI family protein [Bacillota bacterium]|nr:YceI family protein [Bacillota bacterium]
MAFIVLIVFFGFQVQAQKYLTKNGMISLYSKTPFETIEAQNNQVNCALDIKTSDFVFMVLMKSFEFKRALMQEHFNENYVESDKYPDARFKGKVTNLKSVDLKKEGIYPVTVEGDLTIHGITRHITNNGSFEIKGGIINGKSRFTLKVEDYGIKVPSAVTDKIAESIQIDVNVMLNPL